MTKRKKPNKERQYMTHEERAQADRMAILREKARQARVRKQLRNARQKDA